MLDTKTLQFGQGKGGKSFQNHQGRENVSKNYDGEKSFQKSRWGKIAQNQGGGETRPKGLAGSQIAPPPSSSLNISLLPSNRYQIYPLGQILSFIATLNESQLFHQVITKKLIRGRCKKNRNKN